MSQKPVLSVVGPVFNEERSIAAFHERLKGALEGIDASFEIIYVNDGSRDGTADILRRFRRSDERVKVIHLSRNFGHQLAITAGIDHASGEACVVMDTDGQDPPELIEKMVAAWREGSEVVYAVRSRREEESLFKKTTAALFYRLMRSITTVDIPLDAGDFRLLDRKVVDVMRQLRETHRFMRGLTSWVGFKQSRVVYVRKARLAGETHYPLKKMLRFALDAITSFSPEPLRWVFYCGLLSFFISLAIGVWAFYVKFFTTTAVQGWTSLIVVVLFLGSVQLLSVGILGEYLGRVLEEVKRRPLYVVGEADGFAAPLRAGQRS